MASTLALRNSSAVLIALLPVPQPATRMFSAGAPSAEEPASPSLFASPPFGNRSLVMMVQRGYGFSSYMRRTGADVSAIGVSAGMVHRSRASSAGSGSV